MITHLVGCILVIEFNHSVLLLKQGMLVGTIISNKKNPKTFNITYLNI
jgi:hypothetical protein